MPNSVVRGAHDQVVKVVDFRPLSLADVGSNLSRVLRFFQKKERKVSVHT
jgi:hypothetical protein